MDKVFVTMGATGHALEDREVDDYYATDPKAIELLLEKEQFTHSIWECAVGEGHLAHVLNIMGYDVTCSDIVDRGYPNTRIENFLETDLTDQDIDIITNPPYKIAQEFVEKAMEVVKKGRKVAMFLKLTFLEGKTRREMFKKYPPKVIYVCSGRISCAKNGEFKKYPSSAVAYAWFVWEKGFKGHPIIKWIN